MKHHLRRGGFVKAIVLIVILLIILGYFGYNITDVGEKYPTVKQNFAVFWQLLVAVWQKFLEAPALWLWHNAILPAFEKLRALLQK